MRKIFVGTFLLLGWSLSGFGQELGGMFGKMLKGKAEEAARLNLEDYLEASQAAIEKYYRDTPAR